jgi:hypothetical protein
VTLRLVSFLIPRTRSVASVQIDSSATKGRVAVDNQLIGVATSRAIVSGKSWPMRLGTSSPKMMVRKVSTTTTSPVADQDAACCDSIGNCAISHTASGSAKAASPTMPLRKPIDVMPICTVDRNLVGRSCRSIAVCAPCSPASSMTCSLALRLAESAISDMAKAPLSRIRKTSSATSMRTAGVGDQSA